MFFFSFFFSSIHWENWATNLIHFQFRKHKCLSDIIFLSSVQQWSRKHDRHRKVFAFDWFLKQVFRARMCFRGRFSSKYLTHKQEQQIGFTSVFTFSFSSQNLVSTLHIASGESQAQLRIRRRWSERCLFVRREPPVAHFFLYHRLFVHPSVGRWHLRWIQTQEINVSFDITWYRGAKKINTCIVPEAVSICAAITSLVLNTLQLNHIKDVPPIYSSLSS